MESPVRVVEKIIVNSWPSIILTVLVTDIAKSWVIAVVGRSTAG